MQEPSSAKKTFRNILVTLLFMGLAAVGYLAWLLFYKPNVPASLSDPYVYVPTGATLDEAVQVLKQGSFILDEASFRLIAKRLGYHGRPGRFKIEPGWSNWKLIRHLRSGKQAPVRLVLHNERLIEQVAGKVARFLEPDSLALLTLFNDPVFLDSLGYSPQTFMSLFIPNTYEFFWNTPPRKFVERMLKEHNDFWNSDNRQAKADSLQLTKEQVYTLASIVERETNAQSEMPRVAGVYLNRLRIGMPLQADPTLVFASRDWESRDLAKYKTLDSPYNTYLYTGLPPGPISMASIPAINAVLNFEKHDFLFFCAVGDGSGLHNFAVTYEAHLVNVERYKKNLLKRNLGL